MKNHAITMNSLHHTDSLSSQTNQKLPSVYNAQRHISYVDYPKLPIFPIFIYTFL